MYARDVGAIRHNGTSQDLPGWELGPEMAMAVVEPGDLILSDARYAHWPYSPAGGSEGGSCPGRFGLTFMANTCLCTEEKPFVGFEE